MKRLLVAAIICLAVIGHEVRAEVRLWTLRDGRTLEASFVTTMGTSYVLKTPGGSQVKVPATQFSPEDQLYVELLQPPGLEIDFIKNLKTVTFSEGYYGSYPREPEQHGNFGLRIKQTSAGAYKHILHAELYVVAQQVGVPDKKCFLLDRQRFDFKLADETKRTFQAMSGRSVRLEHWQFAYSDSRAVEHGEIYYGYLIVITDARGKTIAVQTSKIWLEDAAENLRKLKVGNYFDKSGVRCFPGRPQPLRW